MVILNLWMDNGEPPLNEQEVEVIITSVNLSTLCLPATQISCGDAVRGDTSTPSATDQLDIYPVVSWPEHGPEMDYSFTAPTNGQVSVK